MASRNSGSGQSPAASAAKPVRTVAYVLVEWLVNVHEDLTARAYDTLNPTVAFAVEDTDLLNPRAVC